MAKKNTKKIVKKSTQKKSVSKTKTTKTKKTSTARKALETELRGLISKLDDEGLVYLVEQARIHIYNMKVDEHNRAVIASAGSYTTGKSSSAKTGKAGKTVGTQKAGASGFSIKSTESGSSYYLYYKNSNVMFSKNEMAQLVKIVNGPGTELEVRGRLYSWFDRERSDIFSLAKMNDKHDVRMKEIVKLIKKSFKLH